MVLTPCSDLSAAAWIIDCDRSWQQLVHFGPPGFPGYVRLRFIPDPAYEGQSESDADIDESALSETEQLRAVLAALTRHTSTPDDCYFCLWDGWGSDIEGGDGHGSVSDFGEWGAAEEWPGQPRLDMPHPAFVWPADHAWCVARDVDPHWAGVGAAVAAVEELLDDPDLDVVAADPREDQPCYYR
jgi:hypothetical protein